MNTWALSEYQQEIDLYLRSVARLYGFVTPKVFLQIFNRFHKEHKLFKADLDKWSNKLNRQAREYLIYTDAIVSMAVEPCEMNEILLAQEGKKYYIPEKEEELLQWADPNFYPETEYTKALQEYFLHICKVPVLSIHPLFLALQNSIMQNKKMQNQFDIMAQYKVTDHLTQNDLNDFISLFMSYKNNTVQWVNCGFTPIETRKHFYSKK